MLNTNNIYYENIGITQDKFEIEGEMKVNINDYVMLIINGIIIINAFTCRRD